MNKEEKISLLKRLIEEKNNIPPLSYGQQGLWVINKQSPDNAGYNLNMKIEINFSVDPNLVEQTLQELTDRHPVLKTSFPLKEGNVIQKINKTREVDFTLIDAFQWDRNQLETQLDGISKQVFDLEKGPLFKACLFQLNPENSILFITCHHIVFDGASGVIFKNEFEKLLVAKAINKYCNLEPLQATFASFVKDEQVYLKENEEKHSEFWKRYLNNTQTSLNLPTTYLRSSHQKTAGTKYVVKADKNLTSGLRVFSQKEQVTLFTTLLSVFKVLIFRYSGQTDFLIGSVMSNRNRAEYENMIGYFINSILIRTQINESLIFNDLLRQSQSDLEEILMHKDFPFQLLSKLLNINKGLDSLLPRVFFNYVRNSDESLEIFETQEENELKKKIYFDLQQETGAFELYFLINDNGNELEFKIEYNEGLYSKAFIEQMGSHYQILLEAILSHSHYPVSELPILSKQEKNQLLVELNNTESDFPDDKCIHQLFEEQAGKTPDNIAVVYENQKLSYKQLNEKSNQLANYLRKTGVKEESLVAICTDRSLEMLIGILGILKAGAAFIPIDPAYPQDRINYVIEETGSKWAVVNGTNRIFFDKNSQTKIIDLNRDVSGIEKEPALCPETTVCPENLVFIIYTSGSTGKPKGVMLEHRSLVNLNNSVAEKLGVTEKSTILAITTYSFDIAYFELFAPIIKGGKVIISGKEWGMNSLLLMEKIAKYRPSLMQATPGTWQLLIDSGWKNKENIEIVSTGEAIQENLKNSLIEISSQKVWNLYGPSEATIWCTGTELKPNKNVYIGKPVANTSAYILDKSNNLVPVSVVGELCIGGTGLARGYFKRQELTEEKFIPNPFSKEKGARIYKTGDLARWLPNGDIECLGRIDNQVKIRGFRIELGEIETILEQFTHISQSVVLAEVDERGEKQLIAYLTKNGEAELNTSMLRQYLKQKLPEYMVPGKFVELPEMPFTPNGKVDKKALPLLNTKTLSTGSIFAKPETDLEELIVGIWKEVLQVDRVSVHDNFFDLGGHSLLLFKVLSEVQQKADTTVTMTTLFEYPTVHGLVHFLNPASRATDNLSEKDFGRAEARINKRRGQGDNQTESEYPDTSMAIIGISLRYPESDDVDSFWKNLKNGKECVKFLSDEELKNSGEDINAMNQANYVRAYASPENIDLFDASFFGYTPFEARLLDPQQRLFLEGSWDVMEAAGYNIENNNSSIGVFAGVGFNRYAQNLYNHPSFSDPASQFQLFTSNANDFVASRVSYKLNLKGPAVNVQTACSTSLVAVHMACQSIMNGECDMALAGGVSLQTLEKKGYLYQEGMIMSPDGHCRAFDKEAHGTISGNGMGVILIKPLKDAVKDRDTIHAVIKGSAINNDGSNKIGYTAPSVDGQFKVISEAMEVAEVHPESIGYVEAHGTGTALGDPIEIKALTRAYRQHTKDKEFCAIGSLKTNIGHTDTAAGIGGVIKTTLALKNRKLPLSLHFKEANPEIGIKDTPFYVNTELKDWPGNGNPRRAGVSAFGIGGTNAHVILEESPLLPIEKDTKPHHLIILSAKTDTALKKAAENLANDLKENPDRLLSDVAYTLQVGRKAFNYRQFLISENTKEAVKALENDDPEQVFSAYVKTDKPDVVFMFSGHGGEHVNMAKEIYENEPVFKKHIDTCAELLRPMMNEDIRETLYPANEKIEEAQNRFRDISFTQPTLFSVEYAMAGLLMSWGIKPRAMTGHSSGEYVAAYIAGVFSLEDALQLVVSRGSLMQQSAEGIMLVVYSSLDKLTPFLNDNVSLAAVNTPTSCVVSGSQEKVNAFRLELEKEGIESKDVHICFGAHSYLLDSVLADFYKEVEKVHLKEPKLPYISNITGDWVRAEDVMKPEYWVKHLRQTVLFGDGIKELVKKPNQILLEIGPGKSLSSFAGSYVQNENNQKTFSSQPHVRDEVSDLAFLYNTMGKLWLNGVPINWEVFNAHGGHGRIPLPTYPFERQRYWIDTKNTVRDFGEVMEEDDNNVVNIATELPVSDQTRNHLSSRYVDPLNDSEKKLAEIWQNYLGINQIGIHDDFFELGGSSLIGIQLAAKIRSELDIKINHLKIFKFPTIHRLVKSMEEKNNKEIGEFDDILVCLQEGKTDKKPLFLIHAVGGNIYSYKKQVDHLNNDIPVYAIQARGLDGTVEPLTSIENMAELYVRAIKFIQPHGPYQLGGYSMGGLIAYEMAQLFKQNNDAIDLLYMIDTAIRESINLNDDKTILSYLLNLYADIPFEKTMEGIKNINSTEERINYFIEQMERKPLWEMGEVELKQMLMMFEAGVQVVIKYKPSKTYSGNILFFKAIEKDDFNDPNPETSWKELFLGEINLHEIQGNHITMMESPNVEEMAEILNEYLK